MIYITHLVYVHPGKEQVFEEFEDIVIPLLPEYGGEMLLRMRPTEDAFLTANIEEPYEVHVVRFESEQHFEEFLKDKRREGALHLRDEAIKRSMLIRSVPQ